MTSGKARALRERLSIDPDAPARTAPTPQARRAPSGEEARAAEAAPEPTARPETTPAEPTSPPEPAVAAPPAGSASPARGRGRGTRSADRTASATDPEWATALDDPAVGVGNGYRSFYVSDEVFARFRAAVYWTARRPDVPNVPDNMSAGVQAYMESVASGLEKRHNGGGVFPPTPDQYRSHRKRTSRQA